MNRVIEIECRAPEMVITDGMRIAGSLKKHYGYAGKRFLDGLSGAGALEKVATIYQEAFRALSGNDITEKQAMAGAMILTADALATLWIFQDDRALTIGEISDFLQSGAAVSAGERGYRYLCGWVAQNVNRFSRSAETGDVYGVIEPETKGPRRTGYDTAFIIYSVFRRVTEEAGFSSAALLSYLKQAGLIQTRAKNNTRGKRISGLLTECVALRISGPEGDEEAAAGDDGGGK